MENIQIEKLKINATNISSSLFRYNKQLIKLKKDRIKLTQVEENKRKVSKKEAGIESSFKQSVANIGKQLIAKPLSLIDKFKEFFGLILLGILVNNLPTIITKFQEVFGKIKAFLDQNPWIMDAVKFGFKIIGEGIMGLVRLIKFVRPYIGGSFKFALDTLKSTKNQIGSLITTFDELNLSFGGLIKDLDVNKIPDPSKDAAKYSSFVAGGGKAALESKGMTVDEVVEQGKKNISGYDVKPERQIQTPAPQLSAPGSMYPAAAPPQKLARGGTIIGRGLGNIPPQEGTGRGGPSDVVKGDSRTPFARPSGTAIGRKTIEKAGAFGQFQRNVANQRDDQKDQKQNYDLMEELLEKFKELQKLRGKEKPGSGDPDGDPDGDLDGDPDNQAEDYLMDGGIGGSTGERIAAAFLSTLEGSKGQTAADAFQVMINRTANAKKGGAMEAYGKTLFDQITAREQFSPFSAAIYGGSKDSKAAKKYGHITKALGKTPEERKKKLLEIASGPDGLAALQKLFKAGSATEASKVLADFESGGEMSKSSAQFVGAAMSFRAYATEGSRRRSQGGNYFFGAAQGTKAASLNAVSVAPEGIAATGTGRSKLERDILAFRQARTKFGVSGSRVASDSTFNLAVRELRGAQGGTSINPLADDLSYQDIHVGEAHKKGYAFDIPIANREQAQFVIKFFRSRGYETLHGAEDPRGKHNHHVHVQAPKAKAKEFMAAALKPTPPVKPTGGQQIIPNFGVPVGERKYFKVGGVEYHAYKTTVGFDFYKGNTKVTNPNEEKQITGAFIKYMESKRKPATTTFVSALPPEVKVPPKTSNLALSATSPQTLQNEKPEVAVYYQARYIVT